MNFGATINEDATITLLESLWHFDPVTGALICAEAGFTCDLTSSPRLAQPFVPRFGRHNRGAVFHDKLYRTNGRVRNRVLSRWHCDRIFREIMKADGVEFWLRWDAWLGVRLGGWVPWNEHKRRNAEVTQR